MKKSRFADFVQYSDEFGGEFKKYFQVVVVTYNCCENYSCKCSLTPFQIRYATITLLPVDALKIEKLGALFLYFGLFWFILAVTIISL